MKTVKSKTTTLKLYDGKDPWGNKSDIFGYPIDQLYYDHDAAAAALKVARQKWLQERLAELEGAT